MEQVKKRKIACDDQLPLTQLSTNYSRVLPNQRYKVSNNMRNKVERKMDTTKSQEDCRKRKENPSSSRAFHNKSYKGNRGM